MRKLARNIRGQFVVGAALIIAILTLAVALSIYQVSLHRQQLVYEPVKELVLGITSDLDRALTFALGNASQEYYKTGSEDWAGAQGYGFISMWVRSILASYSHLGVKMNMSVPTNSTQGGLRDVLFHFDWGQRVGLSYVYTKFDLDVDAYGFKGWVGESKKFVGLTIFPESMRLNESGPLGSTILNFHVQDNEYPIPNLTPDSLEIYAHITRDVWFPANITSLSYLGGGNYTVEFSPRINEYTLGVVLTVVTPEDRIYVSAYSYRDVFISVTLQSLEDPVTGSTKNLGVIQLGNTSYPILPNSPRRDPGTYLLKYTPQNSSYAFLNWTVTGDVHVEDSYARITSLTVDGNGTVTAFYRRGTATEPPAPKSDLILDSRDWTNQSLHLGKIKLGETTYYPLPKTVKNLPGGDYPLQYIPQNSSYVFLWWEYSKTSGNVIWNSTDDSTTLTVYGNGNVTAVYALLPGGSLTPRIEDWSTLYLDAGYRLVPPSLWSGLSGKFAPSYSIGAAKQVAVFKSPNTPIPIYLARYVNATAFVRPNPPSNVKDIKIELGFNYGGKYYRLGSDTYPVNTQGVYRLTIDALYGTPPAQFPQGYFGVIPEGSVIILTVTVQFIMIPWGTFFLYYGPVTPSCIELF